MSFVEERGVREDERGAAEPWMRGTHGDLDLVKRAVMHGLELVEEDAARWCAGLSDAQMLARPTGLPSVAFHLLHLVRSLDRLLTYAEGKALTEAQFAALASEHGGVSSAAVTEEFGEGMRAAAARILAIEEGQYGEKRGVGRKMLPTTVGGLLLHCIEHSSRHIGQAVTTAKLVTAGEAEAKGP